MSGTAPATAMAAPALRRLVAETRPAPHQLLRPMFVEECAADTIPITSMPGDVQHARGPWREAFGEVVEAGIGGVKLSAFRLRAPT